MEIEGKENWIEFSKPADLNGPTTKKFNKLFILYYYTEWNDLSVQMKNSLEALSEFILEPIFICVNAEKFPEIGEPYEVTSVPTIVFIDGSKIQLKKWENPTAAKLYDQIKEMLKFHAIHFEKTKIEMEEKRKGIINQHEMVIFIKGSPKAPKCKFTRQLLEEIAPYDLNYYYFDILQDEDIRSWNRYLSGKFTYPQIYFNQKLLGGLDDLRTLKSNGTFEGKIPEMAKRDIPIRRVTRILSSADVVAVLKGDLSSGLSNYSKGMIDFLKTQSIKFNVFNGESDQTLLPEFLSRAPNPAELPLLFIKGAYAGNIEELKHDKNFLKLIPISSWKLEGKEKFETMALLFPIIVFVDDFASQKDGLLLIKSLKDAGKDFTYMDISKDTGIKSYLLGEKMNYSPVQVYVNGELKENYILE